MEKAILFAVLASFCTATASVCQRIGARSSETAGFDMWLVFRLARRPVWLLGVASMIGGFLFQLTALHYGALALVQPILAIELLLVFGYMAVAIAVFLRLASPSGGELHAPASAWLLAGLITLGVVLVLLAMAFGRAGRPDVTRSRRAALLGSATGISWGFVAAIIKELSSHIDDGISAVFANWSIYALLTVGAAAMLLASHALAAGPLAASQPGFTVLDPLSASLLGVFLFDEHVSTGPLDLAGEALALTVVIAGASILSHSCLILGEDEQSPVRCAPSGFPAPASGKRLELGYQSAAGSPSPADSATRASGPPAP
jgi:hypothetical protein